MKKTLSIVIVLVILAGVLPLWTNADGHASYVTVPLPEEASYYYQLSDANVSPVSIEIEVAENELVSLEWRRCTSLQTLDWRLIGSSIYKPGEFNGPTWKAAELMPGAYYVYVTIKYYSVSGNSYTLIGSETSGICTVNVQKMPGAELSEPLLYASAPGKNTGLADFRKSFSGEIPQLEYRALNESGEPLSDEWTENEYWDFGYIRDLAPGKYEARTMGNIITSSGTPFQFEIAEAESEYYFLEKDPEHDYIFDVKYGCADKYRDNTIRLFVMNTGNIDVSGVTCSLEENSVCIAGDGEYDVAYRYFYFVGNIPIKVKPGVEPGTYNEKLSLHVPGDETVYEVEFTVNVVQRPVKVSVRPDDASKYEGFEDPEFTFTATSDYDGFVPEVRCTFRHDGNSGGSGNYRIYAENVELLNARDDAYIKTEIVTLTGKLTVLSLPYFNFADYLTHDGISYYGSYNNKPVTVRFKNGVTQYDLISLDKVNWEKTLIINEEGRSEKDYYIYLKNSSTGEYARTKVHLMFDYVTKDKCEITDQDTQFLFFKIAMRNLDHVQYSVDGGERADLYTNYDKYYIRTSEGNHLYTVYLTDVEGREASFEFEVSSLVEVRVELYDHDGNGAGLRPLYVRYGDKFVLPDDYIIPYSKKIVGWGVWIGTASMVEMTAEDLAELTITQYTALSPRFVYCIPDDLLTYEIPEVLHDFDLEAIRAEMERIKAYTQSVYYSKLTLGERSEIDAFYLELRTALNDTSRMGHVWGEWQTTKEPNCYEAGERIHTCTVCGETESEEIEKLPNPFIDVPEGKWYTNAVMFCKANGYMDGTSATAFSPDAKLNRAMIVTILWRISGAETAAENHFNDVSDTAWYKNAANWAQENGIVAGVGGGLFAPNATATREQIALIMMKFSAFRGEDVSPRDELAGYNDVGSISPWAIDAVKWAVANGLISGKGGGVIDPRGTATRAETAQILFRYLTKK